VKNTNGQGYLTNELANRLVAASAPSSSAHRYITAIKGYLKNYVLQDLKIQSFTEPPKESARYKEVGVQFASAAFRKV